MRKVLVDFVTVIKIQMAGLEQLNYFVENLGHFEHRRRSGDRCDKTCI
jgi:hypothetical protein